jgi:hypothetical protein
MLLLALPFAEGYALSGTRCEEFLVDGWTVKEVCARRSEVGPIPAMENGSIVEVGDFKYAYDIIILPADGSITAADIMSWNLDDVESMSSGISVKVTRFSAGGCEVRINGAACAACEVCGANGETVSVDCSVVPDGRVVECEPLENVFLPLEGYTFPNATREGEQPDNPTLPTKEDVSDSLPLAEFPEESASPQFSVSPLLISCVAALATILHEF